MNPDLTAKLLKHYPLIFSDEFRLRTPSGFQQILACHDGWYTLIEGLCASLQRETDNGNAPQVVASQVKEKFGAMRFYVEDASEKQIAMIQEAETLSARRCELCGQPATRNQGGWIRTRCAEHQSAGEVGAPITTSGFPTLLI